LQILIYSDNRWRLLLQ